MMHFCFLKQTTGLLKREILDLVFVLTGIKEKKNTYVELNQHINRY